MDSVGGRGSVAGLRQLAAELGVPAYAGGGSPWRVLREAVLCDAQRDPVGLDAAADFARDHHEHATVVGQRVEAPHGVHV